MLELGAWIFAENFIYVVNYSFATALLLFVANCLSSWAASPLNPTVHYCNQFEHMLFNNNEKVGIYETFNDLARSLVNQFIGTFFSLLIMWFMIFTLIMSMMVPFFWIVIAPGILAGILVYIYQHYRSEFFPLNYVFMGFDYCVENGTKELKGCWNDVCEYVHKLTERKGDNNG